MLRKGKKRRRLKILKSMFSTLILLVLLGLAFAYAMFQGGFVSWFLFYSFLPFAIYAILLLAYPLQEFKVTRVISPQKLNAGDRLSVSIELKRKLPIPLLFLIIEDIIPKEFNTQKSKQIIFLGFKRKYIFNYHEEQVQRGEHTFEAIRLKTADALGLIEKERYFDCQNTILVYPKIVAMDYKPFESQFEQGGTVSALQFQKNTSLVSGVRQYQPGDRFAWIDWKATARTNDMMSKEFEKRQSNDLLIILDRSPTNNFELMVTFIASTVRNILKQGGQVGLLTVGEERTFIPINGGEQQLHTLLHFLASVDVIKDLHLHQPFSEEVTFLQQSANVLFITSCLKRELIEKFCLSTRRKGALSIYLIKKDGEFVTVEEERVNASANSNGINIAVIYESRFRTAFSEVKRV